MRLTRHLFLALVVVALCAGVLAGYVVNERGSEPSFIDSLVFIPTVMGETEQEAVAALEAKGLKAKITYVRATRPSSEGRVTGQQQPSARFTSQGTTISLIVARRQ
jgi:beta-lactam-binding protein with PASTA domain